MIVSNRVIANIIVFSYGMTCSFGQDLFNFAPMFSEDYYRGELLKIDYDISVNYYDIRNTEKDVKISSSKESFINILSPRYIYLNKSQNNLGSVLEYITDGKTDFLYFPVLKGASISRSGIVPIRDRFFTDYLTLIPDFYQNRSSLFSIISLLEETENTAYEIKHVNKNTCILTLKQAMKPLHQKMFNEYSFKFIQKDTYWLPTEFVHNYYIDKGKSSIRLNGNFKVLYSGYKKYTTVFLPQ